MLYVYTYIHNGTLSSHQKERNLAICNDVDEARGYHAKGNTERQRHYDFNHMWNLGNKTNELGEGAKKKTKKQILNYRGQTDDCQRGGEGGNGLNGGWWLRRTLVMSTGCCM